MERDYGETFYDDRPYYTIAEYNSMKDELENKIEELTNKMSDLEWELEKLGVK